jgi:hypothetical protein
MQVSHAFPLSTLGGTYHLAVFGAAQGTTAMMVDFHAGAFPPGWISPTLESTLLIPEPATLFLFASGFTLLAIANRRLRR